MLPLLTSKAMVKKVREALRGAAHTAGKEEKSAKQDGQVWKRGV
jgi:hypothetical protein